MPPLQTRKKLGRRILVGLEKLFPDAKSELNHRTDWEFVVAVILSAQCTDKRVNEVTKKLFKKYKKVEDYAQAGVLEFQKDIFSTGFYINKTKNILGLANIIIKKFGGKIPRNHSELIKLPGIGRKTAAVILGELYGINAGIAVDTHVARLARQLGLADSNNPDKIERELMQVFDQQDWTQVNRLLVLYGRYYSPARGEDTGPLKKLRV